MAHEPHLWSCILGSKRQMDQRLNNVAFLLPVPCLQFRCWKTYLQDGKETDHEIHSWRSFEGGRFGHIDKLSFAIYHTHSFTDNKSLFKKAALFFISTYLELWRGGTWLNQHHLHLWKQQVNNVPSSLGESGLKAWWIRGTCSKEQWMCTSRPRAHHLIDT